MGVPELRLFHFSEEAAIDRFVPRSVAVPSRREPGTEWLNGPLVSAVDEAREATYLFPRECPRILLWLTPETTEEDRERWWGPRSCAMIAHVEWRWLRKIETTTIYRYELPTPSFEPIEGAWTWVSGEAVSPLGVEPITDLTQALAERAVELRVMATLVALQDVRQTTLHASGIRLRNATGWESR
jgi:hypothetical protein